MEYKRITKFSDLGTLHALDFNGEEQPLCELTALDIDVLISRLYELENKIESGELVEVPKGSVVLIPEERESRRNSARGGEVKNKQEKIEEIADIKSVLIKTHKRCRTLQEDYMQNKYAEGIYKAGYRKQSDVIKEFVEKVKDKFFYELDSERSINPVSIYRFTDKEIDELAAEFGAEVE